MTDFYSFSNSFFAVLVVILVLTAILQTLTMSYGFRPLDQEQTATLTNIREFLILVQIIIMMVMTTDTIYFLRDGFLIPSSYRSFRYLVFFLLLALSSADAWRKHSMLPLLVPLESAVTLPAAENLTGFVPLFLMSSAFWIIRSIRILLERLSQRISRLTALSIKEAMDRLDSGLLFCKKNGQILLQNEKMMDLMSELTGEIQKDGSLFYQDLKNRKVRSSCTWIDTGGGISYQLPDGSVWDFSLTEMRQKNRFRIFLLASDITEWWKADQQLKVQNRMLEERNKELRSVLDNLDEICREEAVLLAKSRVHDVLGQSISILLRSMREHKEPDEVLLRSFADGLPKELREVSADGGYSLETLAKVFDTLGVTIHIDGWLPEEEERARTFYEIAVEAVTNAVRHGYATEVFISFQRGEAADTMDIRNRGLLPTGPVSEGGGLKGMREKARRLGGSFSYDVREEFHIHVEIPEGGIA